MEETVQQENFVGKKRSLTFGEYESILRGRNDLRFDQRLNLVMSPVRSVDSGVAVPNTSTRRRSETWHGAVVHENQVVENTGSRLTGPLADLKDILQEIITDELQVHLKDDCELNCSEEFVKKSSIISKAIGARARVVADSETKIVSCVFLGEIRDDGIEVASQCLLDVNQDLFVCGNFKTATIFAVGTLFIVPSS